MKGGVPISPRRHGDTEKNNKTTKISVSPCLRGELSPATLAERRGHQAPRRHRWCLGLQRIRPQRHATWMPGITPWTALAATMVSWPHGTTERETDALI